MRGQEGFSRHKGSSVLLWWGTEAVILVAHTYFQIPTTSALGTAGQSPRDFFNIQIFCRMFTSTLGAQSSFYDSQQQTRREENLEAEGIAETPNAFTCWQLSSEVRALPQSPDTSPSFATNSEETQHRVAKHTGMSKQLLTGPR